MKDYIINKKIVPERMIYNNKIYKITYINSNYIIDKYSIRVTDGKEKLISIKLDADHCNCDPITDIFCLSANVKYKKLSNDLIKIIENLIRTYNINNCYFTPFNFIEYEPYDNQEYKQKTEQRENSIFNKISNFFNFRRLGI
jgi:hypothetical protein